MLTGAASNQQQLQRTVIPNRACAPLAVGAHAFTAGYGER